MRRIPYSLTRDRCPSARDIDAARDVSRSVHDLLQPPSAPHVCQSVPAGTAERQRPEIDAADARSAERSRFVPRSAALHHALDVGRRRDLATGIAVDAGGVDVEIAGGIRVEAKRELRHGMVNTHGVLRVPGVADVLVRREA